jgi:hypothetical protein
VHLLNLRKSKTRQRKTRVVNEQGVIRKIPITRGAEEIPSIALSQTAR